MSNLMSQHESYLQQVIREQADKIARLEAEYSDLYSSSTDRILELMDECAALRAERDAHWAEHRLLQIALSEIGGAKSVTATPTQFYQHLQREANKALSENAMREGVLWDVPKSGAMQAGEKS